MSERMTDESLAYQRQKIEVEDGAYAWLSINAEVDRARASEDQKDAVIKALADALETYHPDGDVVGCGCCALEPARRDAESARLAALRLAGRL